MAVANCNGKFLCFLDADDIMTPERVEIQLELAQADLQALVGAMVWREGGATPRYTAWLNGMNQQQLMWQRLREVGIHSHMCHILA